MAISTVEIADHELTFDSGIDQISGIVASIFDVIN